MAHLKDFGTRGFDLNIAQAYLKGRSIEFSKPPYISWSPVMPYSEPDDIIRVSNDQYMFRLGEASVSLCVYFDHSTGHPYVDDSEFAIHNIRIMFNENGDPCTMERI